MFKSNFSKSFSVRSAICFFIILLLLLSCVLKIAKINTENYAEAANKQSGYRITVSNIRGTIYDRNMEPLTNTTYDTYAAVSPTPSGIIGISSKLDKDDYEKVKKSLKNGKPAVVKVKGDITHTGIVTAKVCSKYSSFLDAAHIIGYTDAAGHGVSGLEAAYDDILYSDKKVEAVFTVNGKGNVLSGIEPYFENESFRNLNCVVTTLDKDIQSTVSAAACRINSGAVIVSECKTGKIRAMVSRPDYSITDISEYLNRADSPMINRALSAFSVGSAFKPCVASAAIESGTDAFTHICTGHTEIAGRIFKCHKTDGHGEVDLLRALAFSCNSYFYNFIKQVGGERVYNTASAFNFGREIKIADNLYAASGVLPDKSKLDDEFTLANFSIGQGIFSASPVCMLNLYNAIASDGCYYLPSLVEKTVKDGESDIYNIGGKTRVMSESTAEKLRYYLSFVLSEGTGTAAMPDNVTAAGKTATAQTGRYDDNGKEINNSWFCGFFPKENPEYTAVIISENGTAADTCAVFKEIADSITALKN